MRASNPQQQDTESVEVRAPSISVRVVSMQTSHRNQYCQIRLISGACWPWVWLGTRLLGNVLVRTSALVCLVATPTFAVEKGVVSEDPASFGRLVRFQLVDEKRNAQLILDVPEKYVSRRARPGPENGLLVIQTELPDLRPRPAVIERKAPAGNPRADTEDRNTRNGVVVELWGKVMDDQYPIRVMRAAPDRWDRLPDNVSGLRRYGSCDPKSRPSGPDPSQAATASAFPHLPCRQINLTEAYFPETYAPGEPWAYFNCGRLDLNPNDGCTARGMYRGRDFAFIIRRVELSRWKEFDSAVRDLLDHFVAFDSLQQ